LLEKKLLLKTPIKFIKLAPWQSAFILAGSAVSGLMQSLTVFSLVPLSDILGLPGASDNRITSVFKLLAKKMGLEYSLGTVLIFMIAFIGCVALIKLLSQSYSARVSAGLVRRLRLHAIDSVLNAQWNFFSEKRSGQFVHTILTEAGKTAAGYIDTINFFSAAIQSLVILGSTCLIDARIALVGGVVGLLIVYLFKNWVEKARLASYETAQAMRLVTEIMTDGMGGIKALKSMHRDHLMGPLLIDETKNLEKLQFRLFYVSAMPQILLEPLIMGFMALGLFITVNWSLLPVASVIPMAFLFQRTAQQIGTTQGTFQSIKKMEPFLEGLEQNIQRAESAIEHWPGDSDPDLAKEICFKEVKLSFGEKVVLNGINLTIHKNEFIALVGPSGTGKTTLVDMLTGLFVPDAGFVLVDGQNLLDINIQRWRQLIGYVPQDSYLFHDTIAINITLGDTKIEDSQVKNALEAAGALDFVAELPDGIHTNIGERGLKISGGQRQRLSIARALVSKPQLLILDEATTALDPETELRILRTIRKLSNEGLTVVAVSHQPAVLEVADITYRLDNGNLTKIKRADDIKAS
jgi:ATP-binding cassette, subfamily C, bacterial